MGILPLASFNVCSSVLRRVGRWRGGHVQTLTLVQSGVQLRVYKQARTVSSRYSGQKLIMAECWVCVSQQSWRLFLIPCRLGLGFCALLVLKHLGEDQLRYRMRKCSEKRDLFAQVRIWTTFHGNGVSELGFLIDSLSGNLKEKTTTQPLRFHLQISRDRP